MVTKLLTWYDDKTNESKYTKQCTLIKANNLEFQAVRRTQVRNVTQVDQKEAGSSAATKSKQSLNQVTLEQLSIPYSVTNTEILWCLKVVMSHISFNSCMELTALFKTMFHDSRIAESIALGNAKCTYTINFGVAVFFKHTFQSEIHLSPFFKLCYNESLNKVLLQNQRDCGVQYWNEQKGIMESR